MSASTKNKTTITAEPGKQELFITREFDAPRELVFKAHTDPSLYVQWLGPRGYEMKLETFEPVSGGRYRYIHKDNDGNEFGFHGVFHEISEELMIQTFEFEGAPDMVNLDFLTFEDLGGRTRLRGRSICPNTQARDALLASGMEDGMREGYQRLETVLKAL